MRKRYIPRPFAGLAMAHMSLVPRSALWAKPGMGKTSITMTFLDHLHNIVGEDAPTLVLAPLRVARDTWANEANKWQHLSDLEVVPIVGDAKQRAAALRRDAQVFTTNYENIVWLREHLKEQRRAWPFRTVVADESTKLKGFRLRQGGQRAQALAGVAHRGVPRWVRRPGPPASAGLGARQPATASRTYGARPGSWTQASAWAARSPRSASAGSSPWSTVHPTTSPSSSTSGAPPRMPRPRSTSAWQTCA